MDDSFCYPDQQQLGELGGGQGPAEELALSFRAALGLKVGPLFWRFDALGNHQVLEALSHANDRAHDRRVIGIGRDLVDKRLVNFQDINGKLPEIAQAGIAGAEVIHRKVYSHHFELLKYGGRGCGILHKNAFAELESEILRFQASFRECPPDTFDKTLIAEFDGGNIDGNGHPTADLND